MNRSTGNVVDSKVVELQFQNQQFESNAKQSLSTIERLKKALDFSRSGVDAGLKAIDAAAGAGKVSVGALTNSVGALGGALNSVGDIAVFSMIADEAIKAKNAVEGFIKSVTIDQVTAGWQKYADKTSAVQTIMSATAKDWADQGAQMEYVNGQLEKLNWFTDETSYNFLDMVNNIGKFTSNQIPLEKSVTAMQGISTWAAKSGANVGEASRAMYNLSQAIGVGSVKLMDWRSIENANMATAEFKETVIQTAEAMGTLTKAGEGLWKTQAGHEVSVKNFNENLKDEWFTSEVLIETLNKYGGFTDKLYGYMEEIDIDTTSKLLGYVDDFKEGTIDWEKAVDEAGVSAERLKEILSDLGSEENEFGRKAFQAAQEAKTFQEAIDAAKDAASTAWMNLFETLFGNYLEAKSLWTDFANFLYDVFVPPVTSLTELLQDAFGMTDKATWQNWRMLEKTGLASPQYLAKIKEVAEAHGYAFDLMLTDEENIQAAIEKGVISVGDLKEAFESLGGSTLTAENVNEELKKQVEEGDEAIQEHVKKIQELAKDYSTDDIMGIIFGDSQYNNANHELETELDALLVALGKGQESGEDLKNVLIDLGIFTDSTAKSIMDMSDAELEAIGYQQEQIDLIHKAKEEGWDLDKLLGRLGIHTVSGADHWLNGINNLMEIVYAFMDVVGTEWSNVFPSIEAESIYDILTAFDEGTSGILDWVKNSEDLKSAIEAVANVFDLLLSNVRAFAGAALLKIFSSLAGVLGKVVIGFAGMIATVAKGAIIFEALKGFITGFTSALAPSGSGIAKLITKFTQWLKVADPLNKALNLVNKTSEKAGAVVGGWINKFTKLPFVQKNVSRFGAGFKQAFGSIDKFIETGKKSWGEFVEKVSKGSLLKDWTILDTFKAFRDTVVNWFTNFEGFKAIKTAFKMLGDDIKKVFSDMGFNVDPIVNAFGKLGDFAKTAFGVVSNGATTAINGVKGLWKSFKESSFAQTAIEKFGKAFDAVGKGIIPFAQGTWGSIKDFFANIKLLGDSGTLSFDSIKDAFGKFFDSIKEKFQNFDGLKYLGDAFGSVFETAKAKASEWISGFGFDFDGIIEKIKSIPGKIAEAFSNIKVPDWAQGIVDTLQPVLDFFGIGTKKETKGGASASIEEEASNLTKSVGDLEDAPTILDRISEAFEKFKTAIAAVPWLTIAKGIIGLVAAIALFKTVNYVKGVLDSVQGWFDSLAKKEKAMAKLFKAASILAVAAAIGILAASLYAISKIEPDRLWQSVGAVAALAAILGVLAIAVSKLASDNVTKSGAGLLAVSAAILLMVLALKAIETVNVSKLPTTIGLLIGIMVALGAFLIIVNKASGKGKSRLAGVNILALVGAMALMAILLKFLENLKFKNVLNIAKNLAIVVVAIGAVLLMTRLAGKDALGAAASIAAIGVALVLMAAAFKIISTVNESDAKRCGIILAAMAGALAILILVTSSLNGMKLTGSIAIVAIAATIAALAVALAALSVIDPERLKGAATALGAMIGLTALLAASVGLTKPSLLTLAAMLAMVAIIALILKEMTKLDQGALKNVADSMTKVILAITAMSLVCGIIGKIDPAAPAKGALGIAAMLLIFGALIAGLGWLCDKIPELESYVDKGLPIFEKIVGAIGNFITTIINSIGEGIFGDKTPLQMLADDVAYMAGVFATDEFKENIQKLAELDEPFKNSASALAQAAGWSALFAIDGGISGICSIISGFASWFTEGEPMTAVEMVVNDLQTLATGLGDPTLIDSLSSIALLGPVFETIDSALGDVVGWDLIFSTTGAISGICSTISGFATWFTEDEPMTAVETVVNDMRDLADGLGDPDLIAGLSRIALLGPVMEMIAPALADVVGWDLIFSTTGAISGICTVITGFSQWLVGNDPMTAVQTVVKDMQDIADGLGDPNFIGAMMRIALLGPVMPLISLSLGGLAEADKIFSKTGALTSFLDVFTSFNTWLTGEKKAGVRKVISDLEEIATSLGSESFTKSMTDLGSITIPTTQMNDLVEALKTISFSSFIQSIVDWLKPGEGTTMDDFTTRVEGLGTALTTWASKMQEIKAITDDNPNALDVPLDVLTGLQTAIDNVGTEGGLWNAITGFLTGTPDFDKFGEKAEKLGEAVEKFATALGDETDAEKLNSATRMLRALASIAGNVGDIGNNMEWVSQFDLAMQNAGTAVKDFVGGITDVDAFTAISEAGAALIAAINSMATIKLEGDLMDEEKVGRFEDLLDRVKEAMEKLSDFDDSGVGKLKKAVADLGTTALSSVIEQAAGKAADASTKEQTQNMANNGKEMGASLASGIGSSENTEAMTGAVSGLMSAALDAAKTDGFTNIGKDVAAKLAEGISSTTKVTDAIKDLMNSAKNSIDSSMFIETGKNAAEGLAIGIARAVVPVVAAAYAVAYAARMAIENALRIKSPSRVTMQLGEYFSEGFAIGIGNKVDSVIESSNTVAEAATRGLRRAIGTINTAVEEGIDAQPVIRPVLDLSEVQNGAGSIGSMLSAAQPISVFDNFGAISDVVEQRRRAASLEDVVNALGSVSENTSNIRGGDTYNVNGITYDDGSNIADAVKSIVRAARVGRRS